jgi:hypothetical protein
VRYLLYPVLGYQGSLFRFVNFNQKLTSLEAPNATEKDSGIEELSLRWGR